MNNISNTIKDHPVVSPQEWIEARTAFLAKEKEFNRLRDELNQQRRQLPWERVEKTYVFDGPNGKETLSDLFGKNHQLAVYHFMFTPEWDEGCPLCSFWADHYDAMPVHLNHRDTTFVVISRAAYAKLEAFKKRMGWKFKWLSSGQTDFNFDYYASFTPEQLASKKAFFNYRYVDPGDADREGLSVFYKDDDEAIYHTYSTFERGIDLLNGTYNLLDMTPKGRDETPETKLSWVRYHDRYEE